MNRDQVKAAATETAGKVFDAVGMKMNTDERAARSVPTDAIDLLQQDHKHVKKLFKDYEALGDRAHASKEKIAQEICGELKVHMQLEEEIFYPAARKAIKDADMMDEADIEHAAAKDLIAQIEAMKPDESHYDAKVKVLGEEIEHHVKEEEDEMFAKVKKTKLDLKALGERMSERKAQLKTELGLT